MKPKTVVSAVLLAFVAGSLIYLAVGATGRPGGAKAGDGQGVESVERGAAAGEVATTPATPENADREPARVVAYYFHGTRRCTTCLAIESTARKSLERDLADEIAAGAIEWRTVDYEEPGNEHFAEEFELTGASLILVRQEGGEIERWSNLERVWDLVGDDEAFGAYVTSEARGYLEAS